MLPTSLQVCDLQGCCSAAEQDKELVQERTAAADRQSTRVRADTNAARPRLTGKEMESSAASAGAQSRAGPSVHHPWMGERGSDLTRDRETSCGAPMMSPVTAARRGLSPGEPGLGRIAELSSFSLLHSWT